MKQRTTTIVRVGASGLLFCCLLLGSERPARAQGTFSPVTEATVVGLKLNHYFTPDKKGREPDFEWRFAKSEFVLRKAEGAIPADLREKLLPAGTDADEIRGKWKLDKGGSRLVLTEIKAGDEPGKKEASFVIYKTAPTVIRIGEPQYVFAFEP